MVLNNCTFHRSTLKWTIEYLAENLQDEDHTAYISETRKFLYFDDDLIKGAYKDFKPPTTKRLLYFSNFTMLMKELEKADNGSRAYFQVWYKCIGRFTRYEFFLACDKLKTGLRPDFDHLTRARLS